MERGIVTDTEVYPETETDWQGINMTNRTDNTTQNRSTTTDQVRTLDGMRESSQVVFIAGSNLPGYMPVAESVAFGSASDALEFALDDARTYVNGDACCGNLPDGDDTYLDIASMSSSIADRDAEFLLARDGDVAFLIGDDHGFGGMVFFVHARAVDVVGPAEDI